MLDGKFPESALGQDHRLKAGVVINIMYFTFIELKASLVVNPIHTTYHKTRKVIKTIDQDK